MSEEMKVECFHKLGIENPLKPVNRSDYKLCSACGGTGSNLMTNICGCAYGLYKAIAPV